MPAPTRPPAGEPAAARAVSSQAGRGSCQPPRISTGIAALDDLLHDGYWRGASTLVAGPTGSGKTLMGLHFIYGIEIDQWLHELFELIESAGARRIVIDSLSDLATAAGKEQRYREYMYSLVHAAPDSRSACS